MTLDDVGSSKAGCITVDVQSLYVVPLCSPAFSDRLQQRSLLTNEAEKIVQVVVAEIWDKKAMETAAQTVVGSHDARLSTKQSLPGDSLAGKTSQSQQASMSAGQTIKITDMQVFSTTRQVLCIPISYT